MPIRFKCRHCKKALAVKEQLAGRKAFCPGCRKQIVIPRPKPTAAEVDALAAAMLGDGDEKKEEKPKEPEDTVKFNCEFCDEVVQVPRSEAGTKMPCPECKRIIRIPVPNENKPKDWRDVAKKGPIGAKANQPEALENAWGTEQARGASHSALVEAEAIPQKAEPINLGLWLKRGFWGTITVGFVYLAVLGMMRSRTQNREKEAIEEAVKLAPKLSGEWAAEIHRAAGEFHCAKRKVFIARKAFHTALALQRAQKTVESDLFLIDLALSQIEMGGNDDEILSKERLPWTEVDRDVRQTLESVSADARGLALRMVGTRFEMKKQQKLAISIASSSPAQQTGLTLAYAAFLEKAKQDPDKDVRQNATRALGDIEREDKNDKRFPFPKADDPVIDPQARFAHVEGLARQGKYKEALDLAGARRGETVEETLECLEACVSAAELALANKHPADAATCVQKALDMTKELRANQQPLPNWLLFEAVLAGIEANVADAQELAKTLDKEIVDWKQKEPHPWSAFQAHIKLTMFRQKLTKATAPVTTIEEMSALAKEQRDSLSWPLAWLALARHNARYQHRRDDILALKNAAGDERIVAFLLVGYALGQQDVHK